MRGKFAGALITLLAFLSVAEAHAALGWRDKIDSLPPDKPMAIDGRALEWSEFPVIEVGGLGFRARNDASNLYLLIRGANNDGRTLLSGTYRQHVALWFLKPDGKTKAWGISLDFAKAHPPEPEIVDGRPQLLEITHFADMGITPEMVAPQGLEVSTAAFPSGFALEADLSSERGRQPIYEIQIPLTMVEAKGRSIYFDLESSEVSPQVKAELQGRRSSDSTGAGSKSGEGADSGGQSRPSGGGRGMGRHSHGAGGTGGGGGAAAADLPKPLHLQLTVHLAKT